MNIHKESRRSFVKKAAASSLGIVAIPGLSPARDQDKTHSVQSKDIEPIRRNKREGMHYRMLGRTGMMVSEISLGTFPFYAEESFPVLDASLERGINYFDSARAYGQGKVEENLGNDFKQRGNREELEDNLQVVGQGML